MPVRQNKRKVWGSVRAILFVVGLFLLSGLALGVGFGVAYALIFKLF